MGSNVLRFARRPVRTAVPAPKMRRLRVVPPPAKKAKGHWAGVPGFLDFLKANGPGLTNKELIAAIKERFGVEVTRGALTNMRQQYAMPMAPETRRKAYSKRENGARSMRADTEVPTDAPEPVKRWA